jgi:copper transport protein
LPLRRRRLRPLLFAILLAAILPARAHAHAEIVRAEPTADCGPRAPASFARDQPCPGGVVLPRPPGEVRIFFSEPVAPVAGGISVLGPSGRRVDRGPARADGATLAVDLDGAEEGTYQVRWRVVAEDTHPARGSFAFSVGRVTAADVASSELGAVAPLGLLLQVAARWLHFVGYALAFGTLAVQQLAPRPSIRSDPVPLPEGEGTLSSLGTSLGPLADADFNLQPSSFNPLVTAGILLLLLAEPIALFGQTTSLEPSAPLDSDLLADAVGSTFGRALGLRLAAALLLWTLVGVIRDRSERRLGWLALALALALAAVDAASAHAASFRPPALGLLVGGLHVAAMGLWLGGLAALLAMRRPPLEMAGPPRLVAIALAALTLSGAAMAIVHLGPGLTGLATPYGLVLAAKMAVVGLSVALALAAARRRPAAPRLRALEAAALAAVLALAGALVSLPPPR